MAALRLARRTALLALALAVAAAAAWAHDPIDSGEAKALLDQVGELAATARSGLPAGERAEAFHALGLAVARIAGELNRDLAQHGGELGLVSSLLERELRARGVGLELIPSANRYKAYLEPFERSLELTPEGPNDADAGFRVLSGRFYDSFVSDPFQLLDQDWPGLVAQVERAEGLMARHPDHPEREEIRFILAIERLRAARLAPDQAIARRYREGARAALGAFAADYPESMRAAAARALLEGLD